MLLEAADSDELTAMTEQVMLRSLRRISIYPSGHLVPLWVRGWQDAVRLLRSARARSSSGPCSNGPG